MKRKPVKMKTYRAWQVVDENGRPVWSPEEKGTTKAQAEGWLDKGERVIKVEVREVTK